METLSLIAILVVTTLALFLYANFAKERKRRLALEKELTTVEGESEEDFYNRSKFSELGLMSAGITHEISNPLSIIMARTQQLLKRRPSEEELQKGLAQILANTERITKTIQSVREYIYRNEEQEDEFIPVKDLVNNVLVFYGQRLKNHGIEFRTKNLEKVYVSGHRGQYEQALLNLISNAFDAVDKLPEKWIEVSARKEKDKVQIYVEDSGGGIPAEVRDRIFDPFFTTKKGKGSGLGLSLVKGVAEKHGGEFKYVEAPHTTFMLELPKSSSASYH